MNEDPKTRKGNREIGCGSPRYHQQTKKRRNPNAQPAKKKRDWCKRLKGPHDWGPEQAHTIFGRVAWYEKRCVGCGKKKHTRFAEIWNER